MGLTTFIMGRMHTPGKGISGSALPYRRTTAPWLKCSAEEVVEQIVRMAKKGLRPSQIGVILRFSWCCTGPSHLLKPSPPHLEDERFGPEIPEDLYHLIKKAVAIRKHLERNRKDTDSKFRLIQTESRIHRLARWYKSKAILP